MKVRAMKALYTYILEMETAYFQINMRTLKT